MKFDQVSVSLLNQVPNVLNQHPILIKKSYLDVPTQISIDQKDVDYLSKLKLSLTDKFIYLKPFKFKSRHLKRN